MTKNNNIFWGGWKITEEQRQKIIAGDRKSIDDFYFDNYDVIKHLAFRYLWERGLPCYGDIFSIDDFMQEAYVCLVTLYRLNFENVALFTHSLKCCFSRVKYGGFLAPSCVDKCGIPLFGFFDSDIENSDLLIVDKYRNTPSPVQVLQSKEEQRRLVKFEMDLDLLLKDVLTPSQYVDYKAGIMSVAIKNKLRKNASIFISFMREHGTPEKLLQGEVLPIVKYYTTEAKEKQAKLREQRAWEEAHLDELDSDLRKKVIARIRDRKRHKKHYKQGRQRREERSLQ